MSLRAAYTLWAPLYDPLVAAATRSMRRRSLDALDAGAGDTVLLVGVGTGLDLPLLPKGPVYTGIDITPAMLERARRRAEDSGCTVELQAGDAMALPFADAAFDRVVMHLILAVVPDPVRALAEAARVVKPGGRIVVLDKFLRPGQRAPLRRLMAPIVRRMATAMDVVFEDCLRQVPELERLSATNRHWPVGLVPAYPAPAAGLRHPTADRCPVSRARPQAPGDITGPWRAGTRAIAPPCIQRRGSNER
ncbi:MAG: methyltransferase domain-containing protein [Halofilum sp. (in: g-proteobacteria)]|nr:methyltransferase domain-containing protein [Halofilum sp. (in: g-proteobacteria)]